MEVITPDEFTRRMKLIVEEHEDDPEILHGEMDELIMETLESLGYEEGIKIFDDAPKYYS